MKAKRACLIVLYGTNNLGKSTQAKILIRRLNEAGIKTEYLKYPIYDLAPSGHIINDYLRHGNPYQLSPREAQIIYALNRSQYQNELQNKINQGINIIAEDYIGTSLAWGLGSGVEIDFLEKINSHLLREDLAVLFDGDRFQESIEAQHKHETDDHLFSQVRAIHLDLARKYGWPIIKANASIEEINEKLFRLISDFINRI